MIFVIKKKKSHKKLLLDKQTLTSLLVYHSLPVEGFHDRWKKDHGNYVNSLSLPLHQHQCHLNILPFLFCSHSFSDTNKLSLKKNIWSHLYWKENWRKHIQVTRTEQKAYSEENLLAGHSMLTWEVSWGNEEQSDTYDIMTSAPQLVRRASSIYYHLVFFRTPKQSFYQAN